MVPLPLLNIKSYWKECIEIGLMPQIAPAFLETREITVLGRKIFIQPRTEYKNWRHSNFNRYPRVSTLAPKDPWD